MFYTFMVTIFSIALIIYGSLFIVVLALKMINFNSKHSDAYLTYNKKPITNPLLLLAIFFGGMCIVYFGIHLFSLHMF